MTLDTKIPPKTPLTEKLISGGILTVMALIAAWILTVQSDFNPAVIQLYSETTSLGQPPSASPASSPASILPLPEGYRAMSPAETFDSRTLSDKIDGKAELYLSSGFNQLQSQRLVDETASDRWFEVFVFDMVTSENAFAVYSSQRRADGVPVDLGPYAYMTANALFWVRGSDYLELIAAENSDAAREGMLEIAKNFNRANEVDTGTVSETDLFPTQGLDRQSITLIPSDAFGFEKFDRVLVADYSAGKTELTAFVSNRSSPEEAARLAEDYRDFLVAFGGKTDGVENLIVVEILDAYEIIFTQGSFIAGVHEAGDRERALDLARSLQTRLEVAIGRQ